MKRIRRTGIIAYALFCGALALMHLHMMFRIYVQMPIESSATRILSAFHPLYTPASLLFVIASGLGVLGALRLPPTSKNEIERMVSPITFTIMTFFTLPLISSFLLLEQKYVIVEKLYLIVIFMALSFFIVTGVFQMGINSSRIKRFYALIPLLSIWVSVLTPPFSQTSDIGLLGAHLPRAVPFIMGIMTVITLITYWALYFSNKSRFVLVRALRTTFVLFGVCFFVLGTNTAQALAGSLLYTIGTSLGFYRGRSNLL